MAMQLSKTVRFREEDFGGIVFRKEDNFFIQLNKSGYRLIDSFQDMSQIEAAQSKFPEFIDFAKTLEGKCNSCRYLAACVGDCPSYSIQHGKSFFAGGEECPHEPEQGNYKIIE